MDKNIVTKIDGIDTVEAANDRISFLIYIRVKNDSLGEAKTIAANKTNAAIKELENMNLQLDSEISISSSNYKLEHRESGEKYNAGYQSVSTISFTTVVDDKIDDIYALCLKYDQHMPAPVFSIKDKDVLIEQALQIATNNMKDKLHRECSLLNIDVEKLKIFNWNFGYGGNVSSKTNYSYISGATGPQAPQGFANNAISGPGGYNAPITKLGSIYQEQLDVKLNPGIVSVSVSVSSCYVWNE